MASTQPIQPCGHATLRNGCPSCHVADTRAEVTEALTERTKYEAVVASFKNDLAHAGLSPALRAEVSKKRDKAEELCGHWGKRALVMQVQLAECERQLKDCGDAPNWDELADLAVAEWRGTPDDRKLDLAFRDQDPTLTLPYQGLDRSKIPALSDYLVHSGIGLHVYLRLAQQLEREPNEKNPSFALGKPFTAAPMSLGSALALFGSAPGPSAYSPPEEKPTAEPGLKEGVAQMALAAAAPEPKTERAYKTQTAQSSGTESPPPEDDWSLLGPRKFMPFTYLLAREYVKRVEEKERVAEEAEKQRLAAEEEKRRLAKKEEKEGKKAEPSGEDSVAVSEAPQSSTELTLDADGWPTVGELTLAGFTDWISKCKNADGKWVILPACKEWQTKRNALANSLYDKVRDHILPADFNFGQNRFLNPATFYTGEPLGRLEKSKDEKRNKKPAR